ncbi:MAG: phosphoribosylformylglycinamidine synthase subunit PurS [Nitrososphaeria archaeon]
MGRILLILMNRGLTPDSSLTIKTSLREMGVKVIDVRIGKYVEVDYEDDSKLSEKISDRLGLKVIEENELERTEKDYVHLVKDGRCWEAHEALELAWKSSDPSNKREIMRVIKICVAVVHYQRGNYETARRIMNEVISSPPPRELFERLNLTFLYELLKAKGEEALKDLAYGIG